MLFQDLTIGDHLDHSWVAIPLWLMWDSYGHIAGSLWQAQASAQAKKD